MTIASDKHFTLGLQAVWKIAFMISPHDQGLKNG